MIPASMVANLLTPLFVNWLVSWSRSSLENRIAKLEKQLSELEQHPAIDEVKDQILWGITNLKMRILDITGAVAVIGYFGARTIANPNTDAFKLLSVWVFIILNLNTFLKLQLRYQKDFRFKRSPKVREGLLKSINELKAIRASSPT